MNQTAKVVPTIYTFGYTGRTVTDLRIEMMRLGAVIIDTRLSPQSRNPEWARDNLQTVFRGAYVWIRDFGNRNFKGGPIVIENFGRGCVSLGKAVFVGQAVYNPILLCVCEDVEVCHRKVVAERIAHDMGWPVVHLGKPKPMRQESLI